MTKSILQSDRTYCFICGRNGNGDPLEEHHCFGGNPGRKLSEQDGLKVYICGNRCHRNGPKSVHRCQKTANALHKLAQMAWGAKYGTRKQFMERYGKNYL